MMSFAISGATTLAASDARAVGVGMNGGNSAPVPFAGSGVYVVTLNSGTNTITANYRAVTGGTATFAAGSIAVIVF
jgi:hypothetical protein